jgi:hypothetical protein
VVKLCIPSYPLVRPIGKFTVFGLFVVFGYKVYGHEAGAVLI